MSTDRSTRTTKDARRDAARDKARALREQAAKKQRQRRVLGLSAAVVGVLAVIAVVALLVTNATSGSAQAGATPPGVSDQGAIVTGAQAPHVVTIYQDFQCPICKQFDTATGPWLEQQRDAGAIQIDYRPITILDRASGGTEYSTRSANAAFCVAGAQGADYTRFNDALYAEQPEEGGSGLPDSRLITLAQDAGAGSVGTCITDRAHEAFVQSTTATALRSAEDGGGGVSGTPTVLVDGTVVQGAGGGLPTQTEIAAALGQAG